MDVIPMTTLVSAGLALVAVLIMGCLIACSCGSWASSSFPKTTSPS